MKRLLKRLSALVAAGGIVGAGLVASFALPASAYTPSVTSTCEALTVNLTQYAAEKPGKDAETRTEHRYERTTTVKWANGQLSDLAPVDAPGGWYAGEPQTIKVSEKTTGKEEWKKLPFDDTAWTPVLSSSGAEQHQYVWYRQNVEQTDWQVSPPSGDGWKILDTRTTETKPAVPAKTNTVVVTIDGVEVANTTFGTSYSNTFAFSDKYVAHDYSVAVTAHDDPAGYRGWTKTYTGASVPCDKPVVDTPAYKTVVWQMGEGSTGDNPFSGGNQTLVGQTVTDTPQRDALNNLLGYPTGACTYLGYQVDVYKYTSAADKALVDGFMADGILTKGEDYRAHAPADGSNIKKVTYFPKNGADCVEKPEVVCTNTVGEELESNAIYTETVWHYETKVSEKDVSVAAVYTVTQADIDALDCSPVEVPANPKADITKVCGAADITLTNPQKDGEANKTASFEVEVDGKFYGAYSVLPNASETVELTFPEDSGDRKVEVFQAGTSERKSIAKVTVETDCIKPQPEDKIVFSEWVDGEYECTATKVPQTRTKSVTPYVLVDGKWVAGETVTTTENQTRPLTEAEQEAADIECAGEQPPAKVVPGEWSKPVTTCDNEEGDVIDITREVTTTPYIREGDEWVLDTENATTVTEKDTYTVTAEDIADLECPVVVPPVEEPKCSDFKTQEDAQKAFDSDPVKYASLDADKDGIACEGNPATPTPTPSESTPAPVKSTPVTPVPVPTEAPALAVTGVDGGTLAIGGIAALVLLVAGGGLFLLRRRSTQE